MSSQDSPSSTSLRPFLLERYFAKYEFNPCVKYLLSSSDCESLSVRDIAALDPELPQRLMDLSLGYTESAGHPELRAAILKYMYGRDSDGNAPGKPRLFLHTFHGGVEPLLLFFLQVLDENDHVIVPVPNYQALEEGARLKRCSISEWRLVFDEEQCCWRYDLDALRQLLQQNTKAIVINAPHNPTGAVLTQEEMREIVELARSRGIYLLCDEVYSLLETSTTESLPCGAEMYENAISLNVMAKSFGLAGLRVGWMVSQNSDALARIAAGKDFTSICSSAPSEIIAISVVKNKDSIIGRNRDLIKANLKLAEPFFAKWRDVLLFPKPVAGPIAFVCKQDGNVAAFCEQLVEKAGVLLLPDYTFRYPADRFFRFGMGRANFGAALRQLDLFLEEAYGVPKSSS